MFIFALAVVFKLLSIQFIQGDKYRELAEERTIKNVVIPANRGNVYSVNGNLLATSVPKYDIRIDAVTSKAKVFEENLKPLADSLSKFSGKPSSYYQKEIRKARANRNRYYLLARDIGYSDYIRIRNFPLLNLGAYKGGLIVEQTTKREHPMGGVAERTIGYERFDENGNVTRPGIDGAYGVKYLRGTDGLRLKQKIGNGQWKPIADYNQVEPKDGYDLYTTISVNIQDIAHNALLQQLEHYEAEHGCVVVMEVATGEIRAISNLGRTKNGSYYEKLNYAVGESHEPGSTFKVMALMAAMEDKLVDTSTVVDTKQGVKTFYGRKIRDSKHGGYGKISAARALEVSSNIGLATIIDEAYSKNPEKFLNRLKSWNLDKPLGLPILGEGKPVIYEPGHSKWSKNALPSMSYGYNLKLTPLQTLTFYNAIANNGVMVKPTFIKEVRELNKQIETFDKTVINNKICSDKTIKEMQEMLKNVVVRGTGKSLYTPYFSMAGKTGTAQTEYWMDDWDDNKRYVSSFAGYFPAENPKYSCIVIIHKPSIEKGYYGADVSGPVFKRIAQKIFTDTPIIDEVETLEVKHVAVEKEFDSYYKTAQTYKTIMPNVVGLPLMDALALLENMGLKVKFQGVGIVKSQSLAKGLKIKKNQTVVIEAS
ncbi:MULTISPECIES: penicillin-binding protein [Xanthomarina]|uniref:penicillin-binding protein n=1 Tax=Xanthomarina TaxID=1868329 RepID=UPI000C53EC96|nr:penicillin-binding protein [Xanthomarina sp.]MAL23160.1 penicillin-binding protein [Xanthomarina sp.]MBF60605.1 penicillin-binding protein [Xanthomarina sp.]HAB27988.1 penicillin-binding protein [Xanthomarina gelatinilytica]|tara:strand:- start:845 stop:2797 length:1953 start_codon:yes stop_codon:yes gene_type:complete